MNETPRDRHSLYVFVLLAVSIPSCFLCFWVCDDAYISFRYARNLADGFGLRYNLTSNPPVEGYSNLLWVLLAAGLEFLHLNPAIYLPSFSILCAGFLTYRVYRFLICELSLKPLLASLISASMALAPSFLIWASSGLAPMPFALLLFLCFERFIVSNSALKLPATFFLLTLTYLIRAEAFAWLLVVLVISLLVSKNRKHILTVAIPSLILILTLHIAWRYSYYGEFLPNTANAKVGFSWERLQRGLDYILVYALTFVTPILASFSIVRLPALCRRPMLLSGVAMFFGFYAYSVLVGGDYMSMGRFLVPSLPFQAIAFGILLTALPARFAIASALFIAALGVLPLFNLHVVPESIRAQFHFRHNRSAFVSEYDHWQFMQMNAARWKEKGKQIALLSKADESIVEGAIGNVGYFSKLTIFDRMGLVTRIDPNAVPKTLRSPGHDIRVPAEYFLDQKPTYLWYKKMGPKGLKNLYKGQSKYPAPYAPFIHELDSSQRNRFVVLLKRYDDKDAYYQAWESLAKIIKDDSPQ